MNVQRQDEALAYSGGGLGVPHRIVVSYQEVRTYLDSGLTEAESELGSNPLKTKVMRNSPKASHPATRNQTTI